MWPKKFSISRADQDALRSQQRTAAAIQGGILAQEIVPVATSQKTITEDEHPRPDTTLEGLAALKPIVKPNGTVTAGNASGINDGACALLLASEEAALKFGLTAKARVVCTASAGIAPRIMGVGPVPASRKALARENLKIGAMDVIELNEAFASQGLAFLRNLGLADDAAHVNADGGAIAIGHPLGASGARLITHAMYRLARDGSKFVLCTMCIAVGQGIAMILERI
jgi:acetyl-CoA acyltransferase